MFLKCKSSRIFMIYSSAWILLIFLSGLSGFLLVYKTSKDVAYIIIVISIFLIIYNIIYILRSRIINIKKLIELCGCPTYWPRKYSFVCNYINHIICYNYVTNKFYIIKPIGAQEEIRLKVATPIDYYCAKYLYGEVRIENNIMIYRGKSEYLSNKVGYGMRGNAVIISGENLEEILGVASWEKAIGK